VAMRLDHAHYVPRPDVFPVFAQVMALRSTVCKTARLYRQLQLSVDSPSAGQSRPPSYAWASALEW
jgi:hypothetical protein